MSCNSFRQTIRIIQIDLSLSDKNVQIWLDALNAASGTSYDLSEMSNEQAWDLGAIMLGDQMLRVDAVDEAKIYADAGADVYVLYFDMEQPVD